MTRAVVAVALITIPAASTPAKRREGKQATSVYTARIPVAVRFGDVMVPPRTYRVTLSSHGFALADPNTMVWVATVPIEESELPEAAAEPSVTVRQRGATVELVMIAGDRQYRAIGTSSEVTQREPTLVVLAAKSETRLERRGPVELSGVELVERAVKRYFGGIKHCVDKAQRNRWMTDDPRFYRCVCPIVLRWRLPRVKSELVMHYPLARGRSGMTFTATPEGKVASCRVWIGAKPPEEPAKATMECEATAAAEPTPSDPSDQTSAAGEQPSASTAPVLPDDKRADDAISERRGGETPP